MTRAVEQLLFDVVVERATLADQQSCAHLAGRDLDGFSAAQAAHLGTVGEHLGFVFGREVAHSDDVVGAQHERPKPERVGSDEVEHQRVGVPDHARPGARQVVGGRTGR